MGPTLKDVVTVIRLVPLAGSARVSGELAIVASFVRASMRTEGDAITTLGSAVHANARAAAGGGNGATAAGCSSRT